MRLSLSQIWDLWGIVKRMLGLVKEAQHVIEDKPTIAQQQAATANKIQSGQPLDETDPQNKYHLNQ